MTEAEFRAYVKTQMVRCGWTVLLDMSDRRRMPTGLRGAPDILFITHRNVLVWFEAKAPNAKRKPSQLEWHERVRPHLCSWHRYVCTDDWDDWLDQIADLL